MVLAKKNLQKQPAPGGELGGLLDRLELLLSKLGSGLQNPLEILELIDRVEIQFAQLKQQGASAPEAEAQYATCQAALKAGGGAFLKELGGAGALQAARKAKSAPRQAWWWYLDEYVARQRQASVRRALVIVLIFMVVFTVFGFVYQKFLAPDPITLAVYSAGSRSDDLAGQGKFAEAAAAVEAGLGLVPDSRELLVRKGALLVLAGKPTEAEAAFTQARPFFAGAEEFFLLRAQVYQAYGSLERSLGDAQAAIAANPQSTVGYMLLGTAQELQGKLREAYTSYQKAIDLSEAQGQDGLTAQIKVKQAYLIQTLSNPLLQTPYP